MSIFVQSVLYGASLNVDMFNDLLVHESPAGNYMTLFFATTKALLRKHPPGTLNPLRGKMLFVSFLMFGIATTVRPTLLIE